MSDLGDMVGYAIGRQLGCWALVLLAAGAAIGAIVVSLVVLLR